MPLKLKIYEFCPKCGDKTAHFGTQAHTVWRSACKGCPKPPGPPSPPQMHYLSHVRYIQEPDYEVLAISGIYQIK